jgi:hypothetical protein
MNWEYVCRAGMAKLVFRLALGSGAAACPREAGDRQY